MFIKAFKDYHRQQWEKEYEGFEASNLHTKDVLEIQGIDYLFVNYRHPVTHLIRINKELIGVDIDQVPLIDGAWIKMTRGLFECACETIRTRILYYDHSNENPQP